MSTWIRAGTVTVTQGSDIVTGAGTSWVGTVKRGDEFMGPDNKSYEVDEVQSATAIKTVETYAGATASGQAYKIKPTNAITVPLAAAIQALIQKIDTGGAGSGLDADLLDGLHADQLLRRDIDSWVAGAFGVGMAPAHSVRLALSAGSGFTLVGRDAGGTVDQLRVSTNGDIYNTNGTYGSLSDARLKTEIRDATSQWDDLKALKLRKYCLKASGETHLGVVAQELAQAGMDGLIKEAPGLSEDDDPVLTVKYSVLFLKALGALQEAMARIEALEAQGVTEPTGGPATAPT